MNLPDVIIRRSPGTGLSSVSIMKGYHKRIDDFLFNGAGSTVLVMLNFS